jgi:hypothetical protein
MRKVMLTLITQKKSRVKRVNDKTGGVGKDLLWKKGVNSQKRMRKEFFGLSEMKKCGFINSCRKINRKESS